MRFYDNWTDFVREYPEYVGVEPVGYVKAFLEGVRRWKHNHGEPDDMLPRLQMLHSAHSHAHTRYPSRDSMRIITILAKRINRFNQMEAA